MSKSTYEINTKTGRMEWRLDGLLHREDGPAYINDIGDEYWYLYGLFHREDGPAIKAHNYVSWYFHGKYIRCSSQEEFERLMRLKAFW
jgi:hypothetical protein